MNSKDVIAFFGGVAATARALGISSSAVSQWGDEVPEPREFQIEVLSNGHFMARRPEPVTVGVR